MDQSRKMIPYSIHKGFPSTTIPPLIFYAEDDDLMTRLFIQTMGNIAPDFQVKIFPNGEELLKGLAHLENEYKLMPNLILLDIEMPVKDGISTLKTLRELTCYNQLPIVMFSSMKGGDLENQLLSLGANKFMNKEFDFELMESALKEIDTQWSHLFSQNPPSQQYIEHKK